LTWPALNIVVGARSAALMFIFFVLIIFLRNQRRLKSHHILLFVLFLAGLFYGMNVLLLKRISEMGVDYVEIAKISGYTHFVPLSDSFLRLIETSSESLSVSLFVIAHYTQYFLHGAFEFAHLFSEYSGDFTLGRYQMFFPVKAVGMIYGFEVSGDAILEGVPRIGVYDTFFGSAFIDFWYFALPFGFLVGFGSSVYWQRARHGDYMSLPMYIALLYIIVLVPVVNGLLFAGGIYYLMSFWVFDKFRAFVHLNGK